MTLELQDDEMATVEEMLAFLDSFKLDKDLIGENHVINVGIECLTPIMDASTSGSAVNTTKTPPKRKRIRTGWSSSTGLQRRKRAELQFLRAHVKELETYAEQLKARGAKLLLGSPEMDLGPVDWREVDWREVAMNEFIERKKSEEANRILKNIVGDATVAIQTLNEG